MSMCLLCFASHKAVRLQRRGLPSSVSSLDHPRHPPVHTGQQRVRVRVCDVLDGTCYPDVVSKHVDIAMWVLPQAITLCSSPTYVVISPPLDPFMGFPLHLSL